MPVPIKEKEKSTLLEEEKKATSQPSYTPDEIAYLTRLWARVESAVEQREQNHPELDGMTYSEYHDANEKLANTYIEPKKNPEDSTFQSGTARDKLYALLAALNNLDLSPDVSAFDENNIRIGTLGNAMEDTILKTAEIDGDEEKKFRRQEELLKQGTVFTEEIWDERWMMDKKVQGGGRFTGKVKGLTWTAKLKRAISRPTRNLVSGLSVFLGNIRQYDFNLQPYFFTMDVKDYLEAKEMFGTWERWDFVPEDFSIPKIFDDTDQTYGNVWQRLNIENGQAVIIRYQDKYNNEFAVIINGVLMTPVGLPLTLVNGFAEYNLIQQNFEPINDKFAYGNSLMRKIRGKIGIYDEMLRLGVLTTQQKYKPPTLNLSGRILSSKIWAPGKMTQGADLAGKIVPIMEGYAFGLDNAEIAMIQELKEQINASTVSPQFQGQPGKGQQTATEIVELQRQAKLVLGLTIFVCQLMEWKLSWLRLYNILAKWFDPFDQVVEEIKGELKGLKNIFRKVAVERAIEGEGMGVRMVVPTSEELPSAVEVKEAEDMITERTGRPTRLIFLNPDEIKNSKLIWQITIRPREKTTNEISRLMFRAEANDAMTYFGPRVNIDYLSERFAMIWGEDPNKFFLKAPPMGMMATEPTGTPTGAGGVKIPGVPTPEKATGFNKQVSAG